VGEHLLLVGWGAQEIKAFRDRLGLFMDRLGLFTVLVEAFRDRGITFTSVFGRLLAYSSHRRFGACGGQEYAASCLFL
jgi:hypothetical protein